MLRILAICGVVVLHYRSLWTSAPEGYSALLQFGTLCKAVSFWAVPVFIVLSGYCLAEKKLSAKEFLKRRASRILIPLAGWSCFYLAFRAVTKTGLTLDSLLADMYLGMPYYHLWFLFMLTGLYFFTPVCWLLREKLRGRSLIPLGIFFLFVWCTPELWDSAVFRFFPLRFVPYAGLFFAGMLLRSVPKSPGVKILSGVTAFLYLSLIGMGVFFLNPEISSLLRYSGPAAAVGAISIVIFFLQFADWQEGSALRGPVETVADGVLGVYLIHPFFLVLIEKTMPCLAINLWVSYFFLLGLVLILSFGVSMIAGRIPCVKLFFGKS